LPFLVLDDRALIKRWEQGISPDYYEKLKKLKMEANGIPSCLILSLLIVFTWQLEILLTTENQFCNYTYIILHSRSGCKHFV